MSDEIELISDGDGLAVIGDPKAVQRFLSSEGLVSTELPLSRVTALNSAANAGHVLSALAAGSGQWVQVTKESADFLAKNQMMKGPADGIVRAISMGSKGKTEHIVQILTDSTSILANPAVLAGVAGVMAQLAMQEAMKEISEYLAIIDAKVDDVLRAQKDSALADLIAIGIVLDEALAVRDHVGRVSEVTWSKVQNSPMAIARTQAYALRQLDGLAEKLERTTNVGELAKLTKSSERLAAEWLAVLARCFQLEDAVGVLELDRVLDASPEELERHRLGLRKARRTRRDLISATTERLMARIDATAGAADSKVLLNPFTSRTVVHSSNAIARDVIRFHGLLGIDDGRQDREATKWLDAAEDFRDDVFEAGAEGVDAAVRFGADTLDRARGLTNRIASEIAERTRPRDGEK